MASSTISTLATPPDFAARDTNRLARVWETIEPNSCPHTYNFHLHTVCSDGQLKPEAVMKQAVQVGLKGLAITDHHTVRGYEAAQSWLEEMRMRKPELPLPQLWVGVEITAQLLETEVHILGYGFEPENDAIAPYLQRKEFKQEKEGRAERVIGAIKQAGGLAVLAHPERYRQPAKRLIPAAADLGIDGVETYYAYRKTNPWQPSPVQTKTVEKLSDRYGLYKTCGTDSHGSNILLRL